MARKGERNGTAHRVISVLLRLTQTACAIIVLGLLSRFCYLVGLADVSVDGRIIYAMVTAGIAIIFSLFLCAPFNILFISFPFDFILFIMWLVAFCLLETRTRIDTCSSSWYHNYWGYYWGRFWRVGPIGRVRVGTTGCPQWRTVLAFSFIALFLHLLSGILGIYVFRTYIKLKETTANVKKHAAKISGRYSHEHKDSCCQHDHQANGGDPPAEPLAQPTAIV